MMRDIIQSTNFRGTIICQTEPTTLFGRHPEVLQAGELKVKHYHDAPWSERVDGVLQMEAQKRLALLTPGFDIRFVVSHLVSKGLWPSPPHSEMEDDRGTKSHYQGGDLGEARRIWEEYFSKAGTPPSPGEFDEITREVSSLFERLLQRGGKGLVLHMLGTGKVRTVEDSRFPPQQYWAKFRSELPVGSLSSDELEPFSELTPADDSHLDATDAVTFTLGLARRLEMLGL
jgi:hypothetical protein